MSGRKWFLLVLLGGAALSAGMAWKSRPPIVSAHIVKVDRGEVIQIVALGGQLTYSDQHYLYANQNGLVESIHAIEGQRMATGQEFIRLTGQPYELAAATYLSFTDIVPTALDTSSTGVIRCMDDCTVRQILVKENTPVMAGTPVARVSSNRQEIVCQAAAIDAERLYEGMWAWISHNGESAGIATITAVSQTQSDDHTVIASKIVTLQPESHLDLPEGATIDVDVYCAGSNSVPSLPLEAITERGTVWWVNEDRCIEIPAQIVLSDEMRAWVALPEGLTIAIGEFEEGQIVRAVD